MKTKEHWNDLKIALTISLVLFGPYIGMIIVMLILNSMGITWNW